MEKERTNKNNTGLVIILAILVVALGSYIGYDKLLKKETVNVTEKTPKKETGTKNEIESTEKEEDTDENNKETNETSAQKAKCYGTYYINGNMAEGIYTLKEDGTYKVENQETMGVFTINENTITFIEMKHTVGPREEDPIYYNPKSYLIYDDCSTIRLTEAGSHVSATLEKAN